MGDGAVINHFSVDDRNRQRLTIGGATGLHLTGSTADRDDHAQ
jgi:hypothetical protein